MTNDIQETMKNAVATGKKGLIYGGLTLVAVSVALSAFTTVGSGEAVRVQNTLSGGHTWYTEEGVKLKMPFFSTVRTYSQEGTVAVTDNKELCDTASICATPRQVGFADTYGVTIEASFRYTLPKNSELLEAMHDKVKNSDNLFGTTLLPFSQDLINYTAAQFRAEDFMQGGQNEFKARMVDQATNGMLVTKREKLKVSTEVADRDTDRASGSSKAGQQFKFQVTTLTDEQGQPLRNDTAIKAYGITIVPSGINLVDYVPEERLRDFMVAKQDQVRKRATIVENQENERQQAITAQLTGDRERIEKQNILLQTKDAARITGEQRVLVAELQADREKIERQKVADLAVIDKTRELQVAEANEGIQEANAKAAKYQATAIKQVGFAEAAVASAKLKAKNDNSEIYLAELNRDVQVAVAEVLPNTTIEAPQIVISGNGGEGNAVSDLLTTKLVQDLVKPTTK